MDYKECFKCNRILPIDEFYKHPKMGDGRLNKCKDCTKKDVTDNYTKNRKNEAYVEKERERGREKYKRLGYRDKYKDKKRDRSKEVSRLKNRNLNRYFAGSYNMNGKQIHHWNYHQEMSVFILDIDVHYLIHRCLKYDRSTKKFTYNGVLLDTKKQHQKAILQIMEREGVNRKIIIPENDKAKAI